MEGLKPLSLLLAAALLLCCGRQLEAYSLDALLGSRAGDEYRLETESVSQPAQAGGLEGPVDAESYRMGPGDRLGLMAFNLNRSRLSLRVDSDGWVTVEGLGRYRAGGGSLADFQRSAGPSLAVAFDCDSVDLWIEQPRQIRVHVGGAVEQSRGLDLPYLSRLSEVLGHVRLRAVEAPAPDHQVPPSLLEQPALPEISLRRVLLVRREDSTFVDLQRFFHTGAADSNPVLEGGDRVIFQFAGLEIRVDGPFRQFRESVEFVPGDTPRSVVEALGGLCEGCQDGRFELVRQTAAGEPELLRAFRADDPDYERLPLRPLDRLYYRWTGGTDFFSEVEVRGEVLRPGRYPVVPGRSTLAQVLELAGPHPERADLSAVRVYRGPEHDPELRFLREVYNLGWVTNFERDYFKSRIVNLGGRIAGGRDSSSVDFEEVLLMPGDEIVVTRIEQGVELLGAVKNPGLVPWRPDWTLRAYLKSVGGKHRGAKLARAKVRIRGSDQFTPVRLSYVPGPGDVIMIPFREDLTAYERFKEGLTVVSQVLMLVLVARGF